MTTLLATPIPSAAPAAAGPPTVTPRLPPPVTPEDLLAMADSVTYELVDGQLMERSMGMESSGVAMTIGGLLFVFLRANPIAVLAGTDFGYRCFPDDPERVRRPDVSLILKSRLPDGRRPRHGWSLIPPDLAVEVISPGDVWLEVSTKVQEYLAAGVRVVWVVDPFAREVHVHPLNGEPSIRTEDHVIDVGDVLPGFSAKVAEFFAE